MLAISVIRPELSRTHSTLLDMVPKPTMHDGNRVPSPRFYAEVLLTESQWFGTAYDLINAASILKPHALARFDELDRFIAEKQRSGTVPRDPMGVYFLLSAFALENLLKVIVLRRCRDDFRSEIEKTGKIPRALLGHDLVILAERAGYSVSEVDEGLLRRLSRWSSWSGRYPVPIDRKDMGMMTRFRDGSDQMVCHYQRADLDRIEDLVRRVLAFAENGKDG